LVGYRNRHNIVYAILNEAAGGFVGPTRIMSAANITSLQSKEYFEYIIQNGLLEREVDKKSMQCRYKTTPKGIAYINVVNAIRDILPNDV